MPFFLTTNGDRLVEECGDVLGFILDSRILVVVVGAIVVVIIVVVIGGIIGIDNCVILSWG